MVVLADTSRLDQLAERANGKHRESYQAAMTMLYAGIEAGEALIEAKEIHGRWGWMDWCRDNLDFGYTTACSYANVAKHKDRILAEDGIDTMQKALRYLRANRLTTQSRIDDQRIEEIKAAAATHGVSEAARLLGESFGTVQRYAAGAVKTKRVKSPISGTQRSIEMDDAMIDRMASWMGRRLFKPARGVDDKLRALAREALIATLDPRVAVLEPRRAKLLQLVREMEPVGLRDLEARLGDVRHIQADLRALRADGLLDFTGNTTSTRWHLTETLDRKMAEQHGKGSRGKGGQAGWRNEQCRTFVLERIQADPGSLTEQRLTQAGKYDREEIADACGRLLEEGQIEMQPDATYTPATQELEAAA